MLSAPKIEILYKYVKYISDVGRSTVADFYRKYYKSKREKSIYNLIRNSRGSIFLGPWLFVLQDAVVSMKSGASFPDLYRLRDLNKNSTIFNCMILLGSYSFIVFAIGKDSGVNSATMTTYKLTFAECIMSTYPAAKHFRDIDLESHSSEKLPKKHIQLPWDDLEWRVYNHMRNPNRSSVAVGAELHISYKTVLDKFYKIQKDCIIWMPFFPRGYENYRQFLITLKTDYEVGFKKELSKLDRSSYLYKIGDLLMLHLFLDKNKDLDFLIDLEKEGVIHSISVSFPLRYYNKLW
jgi:hypothetical protein